MPGPLLLALWRLRALQEMSGTSEKSSRHASQSSPQPSLPRPRPLHLHHLHRQDPRHSLLSLRFLLFNRCNPPGKLPRLKKSPVKSKLSRLQYYFISATSWSTGCGREEQTQTMQPSLTLPRYEDTSILLYNISIYQCISNYV